MSNLIQQGDQFIKSDEAADNGYGQNGFTGASSDLPGKRTTSGFLPKQPAPIENRQTRIVSSEQYLATHGMKGAAAGPKVPSNNRSVKR